MYGSVCVLCVCVRVVDGVDLKACLPCIIGRSHTPHSRSLLLLWSPRPFESVSLWPLCEWGGREERRGEERREKQKEREKVFVCVCVCVCVYRSPPEPRPALNTRFVYTAPFHAREHSLSLSPLTLRRPNDHALRAACAESRRVTVAHTAIGRDRINGVASGDCVIAVLCALEASRRISWRHSCERCQQRRDAPPQLTHWLTADSMLWDSHAQRSSTAIRSLALSWRLAYVRDGRMRTAYAHTGTWPRAGRTADKLVFNERVKVMSCTLCVCVCISMWSFGSCVSREQCVIGILTTQDTRRNTALVDPPNHQNTHKQTNLVCHHLRQKPGSCCIFEVNISCHLLRQLMGNHASSAICVAWQKGQGRRTRSAVSMGAEAAVGSGRRGHATQTHTCCAPTAKEPTKSYRFCTV